MARRTTKIDNEVKKEIARLVYAKSETEQKLRTQIKLGQDILEKKVSNQSEFDFLEKEYNSWRNYNVEMLKRLFTTDEFAKEFDYYHTRTMQMRPYGAGPPHWSEKYRDRQQDIKDKISKLEEILARLELFEEPSATQSTVSIAEDQRSIDKVRKILIRFHKIARQLRERYDNRNTLEVEDEYDVQDLLHALLKLEFEDIRKEEWTPSYAASTARMDFLLKQEQLVIEVKKTSRALKEKEIGEQLIIDIAHYRVHPDCKKLVCFIYDPEGRIGNPQGLETDLMSQSAVEMQIVVIVNPVS